MKRSRSVEANGLAASGAYIVALSYCSSTARKSGCAIVTRDRHGAVNPDAGAPS